VRRFTQRVAGYALTASTAEEKLFVVHGRTASGKSTFLTALRRALGDYASSADAATFMERRLEGGAPRDDLMKLIGRRLVVSSEVKDGVKFAASLVKTLFGGDRMAARALYEKTIEFTPVFKLLIAGNDRPKAPDDDDALWRRLYEIPFVVSIPEAERDPSIKTTLCNPAESGSAILAWAVEGAAAWFTEGLGIPEAVRQATAAYRREMDPLSDFLSERCVLEAPAEILSKDLRDVYLDWAKDSGIREPLAARVFNARLEARGCQRDKKRTRWFGIRLRTDADPAPETPEHSEHSEHSVPNSPYTRAHEESYSGSAPTAPTATDDDGRGVPF
jgi:putative DNA primase/helicase